MKSAECQNQTLPLVASVIRSQRMAGSGLANDAGSATIL